MISFRVTPSFTALCSRSRKNGAENILAIEHAELISRHSCSRLVGAECKTPRNSTGAAIRSIAPDQRNLAHVPLLFTPLLITPESEARS